MAKKFKCDYEWIVSQFNQLRKTQPDGSIAFDSWGKGISYDDVKSVLGTHYEFDQDIPEVERRRILNRAIFEAAKPGDITEKSLKSEIRKSINEYKNQVLNDIVVVTTLSMIRPKNLKSLSFDGFEFHFSDKLPKEFSREGLKLFKGLESPRDMPEGFTVVRVELKARSEFEAFEVGITALDFLRSLWNFRLNRSVLSRTYSGAIKPVNLIRLGPVHSLHRPSGELFSSTFWYEPLYPSEFDAEKLDKWEQVEQERADIAGLLDKHAYRSFVRDAFVRYTRSLDSTDHESVFLKLWSLLECLTAIDDDENYGEVIKRVLFIHADEDYHRQVLEHIRARRNASVHRGEASSNVETHNYQLKLYVERLMIYQLNSGTTFKSAADAGLLLSKPKSPHDLKKQIEKLKFDISLHERALKFHEKSEGSDHEAPSNA